MLILLIIVVVLLISPATLLLSSRFLRVTEATFTKCIVISLIFGLISFAISLLVDFLSLSQYEAIFALLSLVIAVLIVSWQLGIGIIRSIGLTILWSLIACFFIAIFALTLGLQFPKQVTQAIDEFNGANTQKSGMQTELTDKATNQSSIIDD